MNRTLKTSTWTGAAGVAGIAAALISEITGAGNLQADWHHYLALAALVVLPHLAEQLAGALTVRGHAEFAAEVRDFVASVEGDKPDDVAELLDATANALASLVAERDGRTSETGQTAASMPAHADEPEDMR